MLTRATSAFEKAIAAFLGAALLLGCGAVPSNAHTTVLSLENLDSSETALALGKALSARPGVYRVVFTIRKAELIVSAAPAFDVLAAATAAHVHDGGYVIAVGGGQGSYQAWKPAPPGVDMAIVSEGGIDVPDLAPHAVRGKVTIMDFSAKWCEPCRMLDAHIMTFMQTRSDIAYRKLDVADWDSALAQHYMKDAAQLPYVIVFDKSGRRVAEVLGLDTDRLDSVVEAARR